MPRQLATLLLHLLVGLLLVNESLARGILSSAKALKSQLDEQTRTAFRMSHIAGNSNSNGNGNGNGNGNSNASGTINNNSNTNTNTNTNTNNNNNSNGNSSNKNSNKSSNSSSNNNNNNNKNHTPGKIPPPIVYHVERHEQKIHNYNKGLAKMGGKIGKGIAFAALSLSLANVVITVLQHTPSSPSASGDQIDFLIYTVGVYFLSMLSMAILI